jgi:hypothetical protein
VPEKRQGADFPPNAPRQYPQVVEYKTRRLWFLKRRVVPCDSMHLDRHPTVPLNRGLLSEAPVGDVIVDLPMPRATVPDTAYRR